MEALFILGFSIGCLCLYLRLDKLRQETDNLLQEEERLTHKLLGK